MISGYRVQRIQGIDNLYYLWYTNRDENKKEIIGRFFVMYGRVYLINVWTNRIETEKLLTKYSILESDLLTEVMKA